MTPPKKPDWMEIADGDSQEPVTARAKRRPLFIAMTALLVTIGGVVAAQTHEETPTSSTEKINHVASESVQNRDRGFGDREGHERGEHEDRDGDFEEH